MRPALPGIAVAALLSIVSSDAQTPTFRSGVNLVEVAAVVRDRDGRVVPDLTAADFEILENGVPQKVEALTRVTIPIVRTVRTAAPARMVASDVATNQMAAEGRIFVLVLDSLHVAPQSVGAVKRLARQFVEEHVGPNDLAAVLSPGGLAAATQDFTADKARLLGAIDSFTGTKLRSAALEREDERQRIMIHDGKDPSDFERAHRAYALSTVLDGIAKQLERVERRRKTLLLFSEGIDYNLLDVMGRIQQHASDVMKAMHRSVTGLMRTNVSLYAIDPRGLSAGDAGIDERGLYTSTPNRVNLAEPSVEAEYAASIQSLRNLAESTGGVAFVTTNDFTGAFERVVEESSDYYVLGYSPAKPARPGEFREISVRVRRPGVRVVARKGYAGPAKDIAAPKGVGSELAALLKSPLPAAGLGMRVQAASFKGTNNRAAVQVVIEVLGSTLGFAERSSRFAGRVELASMTIDSRGRAANGRSTTIDLALTAEEHQRAKATGLRWVSRLDLAPGRYQLRVAGRDAPSGVSGLVTVDVDVPGFDDRALLSDVTLTSLPSVLMITKGDYRLSDALPTPPTAARTFVAGDRIIAAAEVYAPATTQAVRARIERADGTFVLERTEQPRTDGAVAFPIDTAALAPGRYVLRLDVAGSQRAVPFEIVKRDR